MQTGTARARDSCRTRALVLTLEYKLRGKPAQFAALDEAIRTVQFIRNTCLRLWMQQPGSSANDLQMHCAVLAQQYPFAAKLTPQARQQAADRAWAAIARFKSKDAGEEGLSPISASLPLGRVQGDRLEAGL